MQEKKINYRLNFILLICGRFVSELGSSVFGFALSLYVLDFTKSAAAFSLVLSFSIIPNMFVSLVAGSFADMHDKKKIIVATDLISGTAVLTFMCFFQFAPTSILLLIIYKIILSITQSFFGLAIMTAVPKIVGEKNTARANSISSTIGSLINILGPIVGAVAYDKIGLFYIFLIDGISFLLSGISEMFIVMESSQTEMPAPEGVKGYLLGVKTGCSYIKTDKTTTFFLKMIILVTLLITPLGSLLIPYINYNVLKVSGVQLSIIQGAWAAGAIIGGFFMSIKKNTFHLIKYCFVLMQIQAVIILLFCFPELPFSMMHSKWAIVLIFSLLLIGFGIFNVMMNVPLYTYFQIQIPEELRGRVYALFNITTMLVSTIGLWIFGGILEQVRWDVLLLCIGVITFILCIFLKKNRVFRMFISTLEDE